MYSYPKNENEKFFTDYPIKEKKSKSKNQKNNLIMKTLPSKDDTLNNFHKITDNEIISTTGEQARIIYKKKESKNTHTFDNKMKKKMDKNNIYISDGGLKNKIQKFNYSNPHRQPIKSLQSYLQSINVNQLLKSSTISNTKKQKQKNSDQSQKEENNKIFYKTVRQSTYHPSFPKNYSEKKNKNLNSNKLRTKGNISNIRN